nr:hypothetical protein Iba_scaffold14212CG0040 [Ipomoea batatas]
MGDGDQKQGRWSAGSTESALCRCCGEEAATGMELWSVEAWSENTEKLEKAETTERLRL